jgi:hypothetical protein
MANALGVILRASAAVAGGGTGDAIDIGTGRTAVQLELEVASADGDLHVTVETSSDGLAGWRSIGSFDPCSGPISDHRSFDRAERYVRLVWSFGGTSAVFGVAGAAHQLFAERRHLYRRIREDQLAEVADHVIADALISASGDFEDAAGTAYPMPLLRTSESIARRVAAVALFLLFDGEIGFKPEGLDELIVKGHDDAQKWFKDVGKGHIRPPELQTDTNLGPKVASGSASNPTPTSKFTEDWGDF